MNIQLTIKNVNNTEIINVENINDIEHFCYEDSYGASNELFLLNDGIEIKRKGDSHNTHLLLSQNKESFIEIISPEGLLKIDAKVLAFERNNDIIILDYKVNEELNSIEIKNVGVVYDK